MERFKEFGSLRLVITPLPKNEGRINPGNGAKSSSTIFCYKPSRAIAIDTLAFPQKSLSASCGLQLGNNPENTATCELFWVIRVLFH